MSASRRSVSVPASAPPSPSPSDARSRAGSAARSSLPLGSSGSRSISATDGTMKCGSRPAANSRSSSGSADGATA